MEPVPAVSIITPTQLRDDRYAMIEEAWDSIRSQGVTFEWVLVGDGLTAADADRLPPAVRSSPFTRFIPIGRDIGAASARNIGLSLAKAPLVCTLDDDDLLPAQSLQVRCEALRTNPTMAWAAGYLQDIRPDGTLATWKHPSTPGKYSPGEVFSNWSGPGGEFPLAPNGLMARTRSMRSAGGWMALPQAEDFGMVIALTGIFPGRVMKDIVYTYRKHPGQMMEGRGFMALEAAVRLAVHQRGEALHGLPVHNRIPRVPREAA